MGSRPVTLLLAFALLLAAPPALLRAVAAAAAGEWDGVAFGQKSPAGMMAWLVLPTRLVPDDADLPAAADDPPPFQLRAARNEYECVQLIVMLTEPVKGVSVEFSGDFSAATWKANKLGDVPGAWPARAAPPLTKTWTYTGTTGNRVPDPLLPDKIFDLDRGLSRIWLTVHVPKDAKPGDYTGSVRVRAGEKAVLEVPVGLRVWNHVLPDDSSMTVLGNVWPNADFFKSIDDKPLWEHLKPYYDDLKAHRVNATGEIYPPPVWLRSQPPPDTTEYERALKYVLDDLNFSRFRFPGIAAAADGRWQGMSVFDAPPPRQLADAVWISGAAFTQSQPQWSRVAGHAGTQTDFFGGATLAAYKEQAAAWVDYAFESRFDDPVYIWLQVQPIQPKELKIVRLDGKDLGTLHGSDFAANPLRFARLAQPVSIPRGKHTLRVMVEDVVGSSDPIYGVYLTTAEHPDLDQLVRDAAALNSSFKDAFAYHAKHAADWLRERKWMKKSQAKLKDEPAVAEYGRVATVYDFFGDLLPSVRRELSEEPGLTLRKSVEVWTTSLAVEPFEPDRWHDAIKPADELWAYHNVLHTLGYPPMSMRLIPWIAGRHGFDGYLFWSVNSWAADPWRETGQKNAFLRGSLIYPDPKTGEPVDSARWELFREGMEDFETFRMLRTAIDEVEAGGKLDEKQRAAIADGRKLLDTDIALLVRSARDLSWDAAQLDSVRTRAGEILSLLTAPPALAPKSGGARP